MFQAVRKMHQVSGLTGFVTQGRLEHFGLRKARPFEATSAPSPGGRQPAWQAAVGVTCALTEARVLFAHS